MLTLANQAEMVFVLPTQIGMLSSQHRLSEGKAEERWRRWGGGEEGRREGRGCNGLRTLDPGRKTANFIYRWARAARRDAVGSELVQPTRVGPNEFYIRPSPRLVTVA